MKHIYIFDMDNDLVKIGITDRIDRRLREIQRSSGFAVRRHYESGLLSDAYSLERALHRHFAAYRTHGEFFKISFEEACAELDKRKPVATVSVATRVLPPPEEIKSLARLFVETFCTTDKMQSADGSIHRDALLEKLAAWFNANSSTFACKKIFLDSREGYGANYFVLGFYDRATGAEIFRADDSVVLKIGNVFIESKLRGIYWKQGSPQLDAITRKEHALCDFEAAANWDFYYWLRTKYSRTDTPEGDFFEDMNRDMRRDRQPFQSRYEYNPWTQDRTWIKNRLVECGACRGAVETFERLWREYERECPKGAECHHGEVFR